MFQDAIELVGDYTRPFVYISRGYGETLVLPSSATMFFVNDEGVAVTTRGVAETILMSQKINGRYAQFKQIIKQIPNDKNRAAAIKVREREFGYTKGVTVNVKCNFKGCVAPISEITCHISKLHDLAIVHFKGFDTTHYKGHAVFADNANAVRPGKSLCRLGFPYPEVSSAIYNGITDDIEWGNVGGINTPRFPVDGIVTRHVVTKGQISGLELSTPVIKGQNGGPLFDKNGIVYGMQIESRRLNLGYSFNDQGLPTKNIPKGEGDSGFLYVGHCLSADVIKTFLKENGVKYYTQSGEVV